MLSGFGQRGVPAEQIASHTWSQARQYLDAGQPVGEYLCDQLLLPLGLAAAAGHGSRFATGPLSGHSRTHIDLLQQFLEMSVRVTQSGRQHVVRLSPGRA
jgi:RNA 3'-terminal phosphate cyclase (ATP)